MSTSHRMKAESPLRTFAFSDIPRFLWSAVRFPLLGVLMLLEPVVRYTLTIAMVLGVVASVAFEVSAAGPRFPFLAMLASSLACGVLLILYYGIVALLSR